MGFLRTVLAIFFIVSLCFAPRAQAEDVVIVLDASGSMWGQIEGENKIVIARDVLGNLLNTTPTDRRIGLVAYGHNRKGDCGDIEELAPVGTDRQSMIDRVNALNPKGKTPLSKAVMIAAEKLKYTEEKATVVLISDGIETCELDPCEVANNLEELGVDFTAHVVGFDVSDAEANRQLQCLAENTGGQFLSASNAGELTQALEQTVAAPEPPTLPHIVLRATEKEGGPEVDEPVKWVVQQSGQGEIMFEAETAQPETDIAPGTYDITATRISDGATGQLTNVSVAAEARDTITVALQIPLIAVLRPASETAPAGSDVIVDWEGPDRQGDYLSFAPQDDSTTYLTYANTRDGTPAKLRAPIEPGTYEIRYILRDPYEVLARTPFEVTDVTASLEADENASVGASIPIDWKGPAYQDDFITIVKPDDAESSYASYAYPRDGDTLKVSAPLEPGDYELRYVLAGKRVVARKPIAVTDTTASLEAPETVTAGSEVIVEWTGPDTERDFLTITETDAGESRYTSYAYTSDGTPAKLQAPLKPGTYEFRYVQSGEKVIARRTVLVTEVDASISAPLNVSVGSKIKVNWTGPDTERDFITITTPDAGETRYTSYAYTKDGDEAFLEAPTAPGSYEYRYVQSSEKVLFRLPFIVEDVTATLEAPTEIGAGATVTVNWTGPDNERDFITVTKPGEAESRYTSYGYTKDGASTKLILPLEPGDYEYRYVMNSSRVLVRLPVTVTAVEASLEAPATAAPDAEISVEWDGPNTNGDFITITDPNERESGYKGYQYTKDGAPATFKTPTEPGTYELRYVQGGQKVIARQTIDVR